MSFCIRCGQQIEPGVSRCPSCGAGGESDPGKGIVVGRGADCQICLAYPSISEQHCRLSPVSGGFEVEDLGSTNGTFLNHTDNPVRGRAFASSEDVLFLGSYRLPLRRVAEMRGHGRMTKGDRPEKVLSLSKAQVVIGRDQACDMQVDYPQVSGRHARIDVKGGNFVVTDLSSANGTWVNGQRVRSRILKPGDVIGLGPYRFTFTPDKQLTVKNYDGDMSVQADGILVAVRDNKTGKPKVLLRDVSFTVYPQELVAIMGPSGAGKTTLLYSLLGIMKADRGRSLIAGADIRHHYDSLKDMIGYVPQDDIIHPELSVTEALTYAAELRLPDGTPKKEIQQRVRKLLDQLQMRHAANVLVGGPEKKGISGGQRKRVNIALELLTQPSLLFLDEPTSGLASEDAVNVVNLLRGLTDEGKTVLMTIHQPGYRIYSTLDSVIILCARTTADTEKGTKGAAPGRLVYYGPAVANFEEGEELHEDSITFFNPQASSLAADEKVALLKDPEAPLAGMDRKPGATWREKFRKSELHKSYVTQRAANTAAPDPTKQRRFKRRRNPIRQWWILTRRYARIKAKDWGATAGLLLQAPVIGLILSLVFSRDDLFDGPLFLLTVVAIWFGCINAVTEIVKERAIYARERMVFLKIVPYMLSKVAVLGLLALVQSAVLLAILAVRLDLEGSYPAMLGIMFLCSLGGLALGLLLSAIRPTLASAMSILPIILTFQIILGGAMQTIPNMTTPTRWIAQVTVARWGYEAILSIEEQARQKNCEPLGCELPVPEIPQMTGPALAQGPTGDGQVPNLPPPDAPVDPPELDEDEKDKKKTKKKKKNKNRCLEFPQTPVCCKFGDYQMKKNEKVKCEAVESFDEHAQSDVGTCAWILLLLVVLSFGGVCLALRLKD